MQPGEINIDPIEGEFFTTEALGSITDAVVREAIQNSLDARNGNDPVTIHFELKKISLSNNPEIKEQYFNGIETHLKSKQSGLLNIPDLNQEMDCLLIEDFGTRGLQGDETQYDDLDDNGKRNDFYYFWRNIGRTRKESTDIGRWGLGKTVFQAASRINTFFGLTVRYEDRKPLLMGQSALRIHRIGNQRYAPYGYFGSFKGDLALPVEEMAIVGRFDSDFTLARKNLSGLSIVIPFADNDLRIFPEKGKNDRDKKNMVSCYFSVIRHYFFPIIAGKLIVVLKATDRELKIDSGFLNAFLDKSKKKSRRNLRGVLELARWAICQPADSMITLSEPQAGKAPKLRDNLFDKEKLEDARRMFFEGSRLVFRVPVSIYRYEDTSLQHSWFAVYLERDETIDRPEDYFIRQGITIPEVSSLKFKGVRAIVSITDPALTSFLGDSENPAHTDWERNSKKFKAKYRLGPTTLDFVKTSPRELVRILTQPGRGTDRNLLKHIFSLPSSETEAEESQQPAKGSDWKENAKGRFIGSGSPPNIQISSIKGGFSLSGHFKDAEIPEQISVRVAYEVRSGNPFKKYTPLDFELDKDPIIIRPNGLEIISCRDNHLHLGVMTADFHLAVTGFDRHRDLRIKISARRRQ
ncbi:MAG: hypothetical protein EHM85_01535 [Desulfobacteraceae bacterium]|nr:MAG: hypothetical protein EHM85_01535 [Desulfobacteraceae bacterium]